MTLATAGQVPDDGIGNVEDVHIYLPVDDYPRADRCNVEARDKIIRFSLEGAGRKKAVLGAPNEYEGKASVAKNELG